MNARSMLAGLLLAASSLAQADVNLVLHVAPLGDYQRVLGPTPDALQGLTLEIAVGALHQAQLSVALARPAPWLRAQKEAQETPGGLLVGLARTPEREAHWQWVGVMFDDRVVAFTLPGRPVYHDWSALQRAQVKVIARLGSASASMARTAGIHVQGADDMSSNFLALINEQAAVLLTQEMDIYPTWQQMMQSPYRAQFLTGLKGARRTPIQSLPLWMVLAPGTPASTVARLRLALASFRQTAEYHAIVARYQRRAAMLEQGQLPSP